VKEKDIGQQYF